MRAGTEAVAAIAAFGAAAASAKANLAAEIRVMVAPGDGRLPRSAANPTPVDPLVGTPGGATA